MNSSRLPGKTLFDLNGKPVIRWTIDRLLLSQYIKKIIVATSLHKSDDILAKYCKNNKISYYRGSQIDVASRFIQIMASKSLECFVRICGDSPLIDPNIINRAITLFENTDCDLLSNTNPRTFPKGQSVEIIKKTIFNTSYQNFNISDKEHVTKYFYKNSSTYRIASFISDQKCSDVKLSIDEKDDYINIYNIIKKTNGKPPLKWQDLVSL
jgi:spore coat polysaccharide biosynthesis protein SpsF